MTFRFVEARNAVYPLIVLRRVLEVSRPGYCAWRQRRVDPVQVVSVIGYAKRVEEAA